MGIASFLGNFDLNALAELAQGAAEINRPGGNLANLEQNRIAQKLMQLQMDEKTADLADKKKRRGALDQLVSMGPPPKAPNPQDFARQGPESISELPAKYASFLEPNAAQPELMNAPRFDIDAVRKSLMRNPLPAPELDAARQQFSTDRTKFSQDQQRNLLTAYPELGGQLALKNMTPDYQKIGNTLGVIENGEFSPLYTDPQDITPIEQARLDQADKTAGQRHDEAMARIGAIEGAANARALPKPPKDYFPNPKNKTAREDADFVVIPGSPTDIKQKRVAAADKSVMEGAIGQLDTTIAEINDIENDANLENITGRFVGNLVPDESAYWNPDEAALIAKITTLKARNFLDSLARLKANGPSGLGSLTEPEGKKITDALGVLSRAVGKENFKKALQKLKAQIESSKSTFKNKYDELYPVEEIDYNAGDN